MAANSDSDCFVFETLSAENDEEETANRKECIYRALLSGLFYMPPERILKTQSGWGWPMRYDYIRELTLPWKRAELNMPPAWAASSSSSSSVIARYSSCSTLLFDSFQYMEIPRQLPDGRVGYFRVYKLQLRPERVQIWNDYLEVMAVRDSKVKANNVDVSNAGGYHSRQTFFSKDDEIVQAVADAMRLGVQMVEAHDAAQVVFHRHPSSSSNSNSNNNVAATENKKECPENNCQFSLPSNSPDNDQHDGDDLRRRNDLQQEQQQVSSSSASASSSSSSVRLFEHDAEAWLNLSTHGAWNRLHNHEPATWSGCYYIKVPKVCPSRPYSGDFMIKPSPLAKELKQELTRTEMERLNIGCSPSSSPSFHSNKTADFVSVRPEEGSVLFFPSYAHHAVVPLYTKDDQQEQYRVSMAFNFNEKKS